MRFVIENEICGSFRYNISWEVPSRSRVLVDLNEQKAAKRGSSMVSKLQLLTHSGADRGTIGSSSPPFRTGEWNQAAV